MKVRSLVGRRAVLRGAGVALGALTFAVGGGIAAARSFSPRQRQVLAFYYGWYGTQDASGKRRHWVGGDGPQTPDQVPTPDHPAVGDYDSHDPATIEAHARQLNAAGVTGIISSWWGKDSFEDRSLALVLDVMHAHGIAVCAYLERGRTGQAGAQAEIAYLVSQYGSHPAWLKVDERPVFFVYYGAITDLAAPLWRAAADAAVPPDAPKPVLIGDVSPREAYYAERAPAFDGTHVYTMAPYVTGKSPAQITAYTDITYPVWKAKARSIYCATVIPGFDDTLVPGRKPPRPVVKRNGTGTFDALWRAAIKTGADWVLISTFNEWHEGSEIEPSKEYGGAFIRRNRAWSGVFLHGAPMPR